MLYCIPFILFLLDEEQEYRIPRFFAVGVGLYIVFTLVSVLFSKEIGTSLELFLRDISLFLLALYAHTHREKIEKYLPVMIVVISMIYLFVSLFLFIYPAGQKFIQEVRLNLLFNPAYNHKTIGDYLTLGIVISLYYFFIKKIYWYKYIVVIFIPFFLLSFSRSSYIVLALTCSIGLFLFRKEFKRTPLLLLASIGLNIIFFLMLCGAFVTRIQGNIFIFVQDYVQKYISIYTRPFTQSHLPFWIAGWKGFLLAPLTGIGPGTFQDISYRFTESVFLWSNTSFNFIIDLLAEQGILSTISFCFILLFTFLHAKKRGLFFLLFLALFLSFMSFATYQYIQIRLLFFICIGLLLPEKKSYFILNKKLCIVLSLGGLLFLQLFLLHTVLINQNNPHLAYALYPFDRENLKKLIEKEYVRENNKSKLHYYLNQYERFFSVDPMDLEYLGDMYARIPEYKYQKKAISLYEESFVWGTFSGGNIILRMKKVCDLKMQIEGKDSTRLFIKKIAHEYERILKSDPGSGFEQKKVYRELTIMYVSIR